MSLKKELKELFKELKTHGEKNSDYELLEIIKKHRKNFPEMETLDEGPGSNHPDDVPGKP